MARDVILIAVLIFSLGLGFLAIHFMINTALDRMMAIPTIMESDAAIDAFQETKDLTERFDYIIFMVFIGLVLSLMITGWFVGGHALFMIIYFIIVLITVVVSTIFANIWDAFSQASVFGTTVASFPITSNILSNLPVYMAVIGLLGILVMFAKPYFMGGQEQW